MRKIVGWYAGLVAASLIVTGTNASAQNALSLYENFSAPLLDRSKWFAQQYQVGDGAGLELVRGITGGQLLLGHRVFGASWLDTGDHSSSNEVGYNGGNELQFDIRVARADASACTNSGSWETRAQAGSLMGLFNDASGESVTAGIFIGRRVSSSVVADRVRAWGEVWHPATQTVERVELGPAGLDQSVTLWMRWDSAGKKVDFRVGRRPIESVFYNEDDSNLVTWRTLRAEGHVANCSSGARSAVIEAYFDNLFVGS